MLLPDSFQFRLYPCFIDLNGWSMKSKPLVFFQLKGRRDIHQGNIGKRAVVFKSRLAYIGFHEGLSFASLRAS